MRTPLAVLALAVAASVADAQSVVVGARVGRTSASQRLSDPVTGYDQVHGVVAGFSGALHVQSWLALQVEALYVEKGARRPQTFEMRLDYLEAPLLVRLASPVALRGFRPFLASGIAPAVELRCSGYYQGGRVIFHPLPIVAATLPPGAYPLDCQSQRTRYTDRSQVLTGGVSFERGRHEFSLELRRTRGSDISGYGWTTMRNDVTALVLGVSRRLR